MTHLKAKAVAALSVTLVVMAVLLFVPAGTLDYPQAWLLLAAYGGAAIGMTVYLLRHDRKLLEGRLRGGPIAETSPVQRIAMWGASLGFIAILVVSGFDHRAGWSSVPPAVADAGIVMLSTGLVITLRVIRENSFASATIQVASDQRVVSTGPYALVRHPMYTGALLYLVGMPLALGSYWALLGVALINLALVLRLLNEEQLLTKSLPGYAEYCARVKYRLFPGIW